MVDDIKPGYDKLILVDPILESLTSISGKLYEKSKGGEVDGKSPVLKLYEIINAINITYGDDREHQKLKSEEGIREKIRGIINTLGKRANQQCNESFMKAKSKMEGDHKYVMNLTSLPDLEFNLKNGNRGDRNVHVKELFNSLCKSEDTIMVNNNAAAVILMLNSICENKEVIISRGQLVEIGGSFRIPDIMLKSKCKMKEIGTTNKTHLYDYEKAITKKTAAILYVHTSNYKVVGFSNEIQIADLSKISKKYNIPLLVDLGSGSIADFKSMGLSMEKIISKYIKMGSDVVTFSGDKLLGGPQAGIITGRKKYIKKIQQNSFYRAFRCDKIRISIMETILRTYYTKENIKESNLTIQLFKRKLSVLNEFGKKIISSFKNNKTYKVRLEKSFVEAGSGSLPTEKISSYSILIKSNKYKANHIYNKFLIAEPPVVGYIKDDIFRIDLKAIPQDQINLLVSSIKQCLL